MGTIGDCTTVLSVCGLMLLCDVDVGSKQTADSKQKLTKSADFEDFILREDDGDKVFMKDSRQNEENSSDICMVLYL